MSRKSRRREALRQRREAAMRADEEAGQSQAEMRSYTLFEEWKRGYLSWRKSRRDRYPGAFSHLRLSSSSVSI